MLEGPWTFFNAYGKSLRFSFFVKIMIFTHHDSRAPVMISHPNSCAPGGECFAPPLPQQEGVPPVLEVLL